MTNEKNMNTTTLETKAEKNIKKAVLKKLTAVSVKSDGMSTEDITVEIPTFVKSPEIFFNNVQTLYFQVTSNNFQTQINTIDETLKNEPGDTMNRRTLEQKKEYLENAIVKLNELYSEIADTHKDDADKDRVANLFVIAAGYKRVKEVDSAMEGIYNDIVKHYNIYISGIGDAESEEAVKLRNDSFNAIRKKLKDYLVGQFKNDGTGEEYKKHSIQKLTVGFVNDIISYTYDSTKLDGRSTGKKVASGAFQSRRKRATTVYTEVLAKYFQMFQINAK